MLNQEQIKMIQTLKQDGYAVVIFTPDELGEVDACDVEDGMIQRGWNIIESLKEENEEDEK